MLGTLSSRGAPLHFIGPKVIESCDFRAKWGHFSLITLWSLRSTSLWPLSSLHCFKSTTHVLANILFRRRHHSRGNSCAVKNGVGHNKGADVIFTPLEESILAKNVDCPWSLCPSIVVLPSLDLSISIAKPCDETS